MEIELPEIPSSSGVKESPAASVESGAPPKAKRKRPDRAAKFQKRKETRETVVPCSLHGVLHGNPEQKRRFIQAVEQRVVAYSHRISLASVAINLLVREDFSGIKTKDLAAFHLDYEFDDVNTVRQAILGTKGCGKTTLVQRVKEFFQQHPDLLHDPGDRSFGDGNIYTHGATRLLTNIRNHLKTNLIKIVKKVAYNCTEGTNRQQVLMLFRICGWPDPKPRPRSRPGKLAGKESPPLPPVELSTEQTQLVTDCRAVLGLREGQKVSESWLDSNENSFSMLKFFVLALRLLEARELKLFNLLPVCKRKRHFLTVDTDGLYGIARDIKLVGEDCSSEAFRALGEAHWRSVLKVERLLPKGGEFTGTIDTDGVSVRIHIERPLATSFRPGCDGGHSSGSKKKPGSTHRPRPSKEKLDVSRVIAVDPGRSNIVYAVEVLPDESIKEYRLTRQQYYREGGILKARQQTARWNRNIKRQLEALSEVSSKGCSLESFLRFADVYLSTACEIWREMLRRRWAHQRFRLLGRKKSVLSRFFNSIEEAGKKRGDKRPILVAYGSAKMASGGKGEVSVPVNRTFRECSRRFETHGVDEFRTTRIHHGDDSLLEKVGVPKQQPGKDVTVIQDVRGLLWWGTSKKGKFVSRDRNGALNILRCFLEPERPYMLDRREWVGRPLPDAKVLKRIRR